MSLPKIKSQTNTIEKNENNYLLNIMKTWLDGNNNTHNESKEDNFNRYEHIIDNNTIIRNSNINYDNLPNWPKRSPFEFYNKNVIIPEDYKLSTIEINDNEKLNSIKDDLNPFISKNETESNNNGVKISLISPNTNKSNDIDNNNILINQIQEKENSEEENKIEEDKNDINNDKNYIEEKNNENKNDINFDEENNEYIFGHKKDEKLEPIKLSLIRDTIGEDEEKISQFHNQIEKEKYEQSLKENNFNNMKIPNKKLTNFYNYRNDQNELKKKNRVLSKTEKEIEYFKEKDLFDEELNDENFNITQKQMNILDRETNINYNYFKEISNRKNFQINHPYLEYEKFLDKERNISQSIDNQLSVTQKNEIKQNRMKHILAKQKSIIENIIFRKHILNSHNSMNNIYSNPKNLNKDNSSTSIFKNNSINIKSKNKSKPKSILNYRSYNIKDYMDKYKNQKMSNFGGLGPNIGGDEWMKRQKLLDRKKEYSNYVLFNEKRNLEEKKTQRSKVKLIKKFKINDNNGFNEIIKINNDKTDFKFPLIKQKYSERNTINNADIKINEKKIYNNPYKFNFFS